MSRRTSHGRACERARALASSQFDGVLPEFERRELDRHLDGCADCAALVADMAVVVARLRSAAPVVAVLAGPARPARRRRVGLRLTGGAAALAAAAALGFVVGTPQRQAPVQSPRPPVVAQRGLPDLNPSLDQSRVWMHGRPSAPAGATSRGRDHGFLL